MSVYRCDYIIHGWKLPWDKEWSRELLDETRESYPYFDGGKNGCELIVDQMGGHFIVFGQVVFKKNYPYANEASDMPIEFENLSFPSLEDKELVQREYAQCIGVDEVLSEPYTFIFSHIY